MKFIHAKILQRSVFLLGVFLTACGGNSGGGSAATAPTFTIGGTLTGLTGTGLVLQNNAADDLAVSADGAFTFVTPSAAYAVTVKTQPGNPLQTCTVNSGSGTASANVSGVTVACSTNAYTVSGTVSGLAGTGLVLQDNNGDDLTITANGEFTFATSVASGANYNVSVSTQPTLLSQICTVTNGAGTVTDANIGGVAVNCAAPVPRFAYVTGSDTVSVYTVNPATGQLRYNGYVVAAGTAPTSVTVDPSGKFAYVANQASDDVSAYTINTNTGALSSVGTPVSAGTTPYSVTVDPSGKFAYVANWSSNNVSAYAINAATGALASVGAPVVAGSHPQSVTVDPSGKFAYVANSGSGNVSAYRINVSTGVLTTIGAAENAGITPRSVTVDPSGRFAYVANGGSNDVSAFSINDTTGALTSLGAAVAAGTNPQSVTVDPSGKFAYVANSGSDSVSAYAINATTGALTSVGADVAAGLEPQSVTVDPSGKFAYVTSLSNIATYAINTITGALTALPTIAGRSGNVAMFMTKGTAAVSYTPKFAYAANYGPGSLASAYTINEATGSLAALPDTLTLPLGTSVTVDPSGRFAYTTHEILFETPTVNVSTYTINSTSGVLTRVGAAAAVASFPASIAVEPSGRFAYIANSTSNGVTVHTIDAATGALTYAGYLAAESGPVSIAVDPSGRFAYVANYSSASISGYAVNASSGALTMIDLNGALVGAAMGAAPNPTSVTVDPSGKFVYVTHINGVNAYVIDTASGLLINASFAAAGANPRSIVVEPSGRFAYVANADSANVSVFSINPISGALTGVGTAAAGDQPWFVTVDPSGKFAYVANSASNDVSIYTIDKVTGALTQVGTAAAGTVPVSIATTGTIQ